MANLKNHIDYEKENNLKNNINETANQVKKTLRPPFFQFISDIVAIVISYSLQYYFIYYSGLVKTANTPGAVAFLMTLTTLLIFWTGFFFFSGMYKNWYVRSPFDELFAVLQTVFVGCAIIVFLVLLDTSQKPRYSFLIFFPVLAFVISTLRFISRRIQISLRKRRIIEIPSIIVGTKDKVINLFRKADITPEWGFKITGLLFTDTSVDEKDNINLPVFYGEAGFSEILDSLKPEEVLITTDKPDHHFLLKVISECAEQKTRVKIRPDMYNIFSGQTKTLHLYGIPLIEVSSQLLKPWQEAAKRIFDIVFSFLILVVGFPFWIIIGIIIKIETKGPAFYLQPRVGKNGKIFNIYKFRSMVVDADKKGLKWTEVNDSRVTKVGKFIRKTHLDEIPQFLNVLKGDMSIVGPRPEQPVFTEKFNKEVPFFKRRLVVRPGITGWWQIKSHPYVLDKDEIEHRLKFDFYYIENMSLKLDLEIIVRTVWRVFSGQGQA